MKDGLKKLIANLFDCDVADILDETGPGDLKGWDSLGHVVLMSAIQEEFGTRHLGADEPALHHRDTSWSAVGE